MNELAYANVIDQLVEAQIAPWREREFNTSELYDRLTILCDAHYGTFIFTVDQNRVNMRANPGVEALVNSGVKHEVYRRAVLFQSLIADAAERLSVGARIVFGVNVLDLADSGDLPIFSFQKKIGENNILLPDFELIELGFLEAYVDKIPFEEKRNKAYFAGSTTGVLNYTMEDVDAGRVGRIRAARAFRSCEEVDFCLTNLVQYADDNVRDALIAEGFGGERAPLLESFEYKFGISIDGNGAPCSRPAVILRSRGVLLKYKSPYVLFYNSAMVDGVHYIGMDKDEDVVRIVHEENKAPGTYFAIAAASELFAQRFITKAAAIAYTSCLLQKYRELMEDACN